MLRHGSHSFTFNYTNACLYLVAFTRWRLDTLKWRTSNCSLLLIYIPRKDERLSRPGWLTYSGRFTHISGHRSAASRPQDRQSSPVKVQRSTTVPRNQPCQLYNRSCVRDKSLHGINDIFFRRHTAREINPLEKFEDWH